MEWFPSEVPPDQPPIDEIGNELNLFLFALWTFFAVFMIHLCIKQRNASANSQAASPFNEEELRNSVFDAQSVDAFVRNLHETKRQQTNPVKDTNVLLNCQLCKHR